MSIQTNLDHFLQSVPSEVKLVAVSKTKPVEVIREAYNAGQRIFGENKVQALIAKQPLLPADIEWHFIGHVQTNKVKFIAPFISLFHAVDSLKLFREINKQEITTGGKIAINLPMVPPTNPRGIKATMEVITAAVTGMATSSVPSMAAFNGGFPCFLWT